MRKTRIFINGFGRIGRAALSIMIEDESIEVVGINDIYDRPQMRYLFAYDSIYGPYPHPVTLRENLLCIQEHHIPLYQEEDPAKLSLENVDVLLQCTGIFLTKEQNQSYLQSGAKKVLISAPASKEVPTFVMGVNHQHYKQESILSNSSCSSNAILPIFHILEAHYGINNASMSMYHSYTAYQKLLDVKHYSKDIRRARSATQNIQPLMSSAAQEAEKFFPHLQGKLTAKSIRVPVSATTLYDLTLSLKHPTTKEALHQLFEAESKHTFKEMLSLADDFMVSRDFIANPHGAIIDRALTQVQQGDLIKISAWQDNEYGYANQLVRMAKYIDKDAKDK